MTITLDKFLWILAAICFGIATIVPSIGRANLVALGLLLGSLTFVF